MAGRQHLKIKGFKKPIIVHSTPEYGGHYHLVHCITCDHLARFRISEATDSIVTVNYYCPKCFKQLTNAH
jgi:hypothetical protein